MELNNTKANQKWEALNKVAARPLNNILTGVASAGDIKAAEALIGRFEGLAQQVFKDGIHAVEMTADSVLDKLNDQRIQSGKKPLTVKAQERLYKSAFKQVLQESAPDILGTVYDIFEENKESEDDIQNTEVNRKLLDMLNMVAKKSTGGAGIDDEDGKTRYNPLTARARNTPDVPDHGSYTSTTPTVLLNPETETAVMDSLAGQRDFHDLVGKKLGGIPTKEEEDEEDEKKKVGWFRRFRSWFGDMKKKAKSAAGGWISALLTGLLLTLTSPGLVRDIAKLAGEMLNFDNISKFLSGTWDVLKQSGRAIIDEILAAVGLGSRKIGKPGEVMNREQLEANAKRLGVTKERAPEMLKNSEVNIKAAQKRVASAEARIKASKSEAERKGWESELAGANRDLGIATNARNTAALVINPNAKLPGAAGVSEVTQGTPKDPATAPATVVHNDINPGHASTSTKVIEGDRQPTPGDVQIPKDTTTFDPQGSVIRVPEQEKAAASRPGQQLQGSNAITLAGFGIIPHASSDLLLLNLGI